jgi:alanyl aminopeptidase
MRILCALAFAAVLSAADPAFRLGDAIHPLRYAVDLTVVPSEETFAGNVRIDLELREPASEIRMHGKRLKVAEAVLETSAGRLPAIVAAEGEFLTFKFDKPVPAGKARLLARYTGQLNAKSSDGIFKNEDRGEWYAYTQFEATEARAAFPCFDEPRFKTPWQVTLRIKPEHRAFSNTPTAAEALEPTGLKTIRFAESKPMPSYLVAFAVGPFEIVDAGRAGKNRTPLRIIVPKGRTGEANWAVEATASIVKLLEDYFGSPYPYEKLDSIAVPLFGGAMENPGLITYGMSILLSRPEDDTVNRRRSYVGVAAHEISHMWFGDLVTMAWWDDLWLNESFATWMGEKITAEFKPEWDVATSMTASRLGAMNSDSLVTARKIRQPITSAHDIANAFDGITYGKGGAVLHMFESWLGPEAFKKGVRVYLDRHSWRNATASDFLNAMSLAAGRDVAPVFSTFLEQAGVPVVSVELKCDGPKPSLALAQKRYLPIGSPAAAPQTWKLPVCYEFGSGKNIARDCTLLSDAAAVVPMPKAKGCPDWVLLNDEYTGYYRTLYRGGLMNKLLAEPAHLSASERLGIVRDAEALVRSGELMPGEALQLVPRFATDPNRQVVSATVASAAGIEQNLVPDELRPNYARFIQKTYGDRARQLGWQARPGEDDDAKLLRQVLLPLVTGPGEDQALRQEAAALGLKWLDDRKAVQPEMASSALVFAAREGGLALWERIIGQAKKATDERERSLLLSAAGSFKDPAIIRRNFELLASGQFDLRQSMALLFAPLRNAETRAIPFEYVKTHYDEISAKMSGGMGMDFRAFLPYVGAGFCSLEKRAEVEAFFKERVAGITGAPRNLAQALEQIGQCAARRVAQQEPVIEFLKRY